MASHSAPVQHSSTEGTLGRSFEFLGDMIDTELAERFDPTANGVLARFGDLAKTGTDTGRMRYAGGFGWDQSMTAMAGEVTPGTASGWDSAYDTITIGRYYLAYEESFQRAGLADDPLSLEFLATTFADSYIKTLRGLYCTTGAAFSSNKADDSATADVDDQIALRNAYEETAGYNGERVVNTFHPVQIGHLRSSMRSETALATSDARFDSDQALQVNSGFRFSFLGMDYHASNDVTLNTDYYGFSHVAGAVGYAVMSTADLGDLSDANPTRIPFWGIVLTRKTTGQTASKRVDGNAWVGVAARSTTVAPQFLMRNAAS